MLASVAGVAQQSKVGQIPGVACNVVDLGALSSTKPTAAVVTLDNRPPYLRVQASLIFRISPGQNMGETNPERIPDFVVVHPAIAHDAPCVANPLGRLATEL